MNVSINDKITERLDFLIRLGEKQWGKSVKPIIKYNLKGKVGGMACYPNVIRVNLPLLFHNEEDYLIQTIGHEYAHLLTDKVFDSATPHGIEWKRVMWSFDLEAKRCHNYNTNLPKVNHITHFSK